MPTLGCFTHVEMPQLGLLGRFLGRAPKEHCFIAIQNLLATKSLRDLTAADVETLLSDYRVPREDATRRLNDFYGMALRQLAGDGELSEQDRAELTHLHYVFGLSDSDVEEAHRSILREIYRDHLIAALADSRLSADEKTRLERIGASFGLSEATIKLIYEEEAGKVLQRAFDAAVTDQRYTAEEEARITEMGRNFGITVRHSDEDRAIERFRRLARIEAGKLPEIAPSIRLQRGEACHAEFPCRLFEKRTVTKRVNYSGLTGRMRITKGLSFRHGSISVSRVTAEQMRQLDAGTLYITNKRLVFNGAAKNQNIPFKKVIGFTTYRDGLQIEKDTGRDQYFVGEDDMEMLAAILDGAISKAHQGA